MTKLSDFKMTNKIKAGIAVAIVSLAAATGIAFAALNADSHYYAEEISMDSLPETIQEQALEDVQNGGAYFYRDAENEDISYVLLSFGSQMDLDMAVETSEIDDGLYFSVGPIETEAEEGLVYKVFETNAPAVSSDKNVLQNPRLVQGSTGLNVGYIQKSDTGYYVSPLEDDSTNDRLYAYDGELPDGLYRFTYELGQDGPVITNADAIEKYSKKGYVTDVNVDLSTVSLVLVGEQEIKYNMYFDAADYELLHILQDSAQHGNNAVMNFTFHHKKNLGLCIDSAVIMSMPYGTGTEEGDE